MDRRSQLSEVLARIDGVIVEARSHVEKPSDDTESQEHAAKVPADMERARREVEGELQHNEIPQAANRVVLRAGLLTQLSGCSPAAAAKLFPDA